MHIIMRSSSLIARLVYSVTLGVTCDLYFSTLYSSRLLRCSLLFGCLSFSSHSIFELFLPLNLHMAITHFFTRSSV